MRHGGYKRQARLEGLSELKNYTEQSRRSFFLPYILNWLNNPETLETGYIQGEAGKIQCYVLTKLPYDCWALYIDGYIHIAESVSGDGTLNLMKGVNYSIHGTDILFADPYNRVIPEDVLVGEVEKTVRILAGGR